MIISNVKIAEIVASRGYNYEKALDDLDAYRTPDQEELELSESEVEELVNNICAGFDFESDWRN